jgi:hypothetical protein
MDFIQIFQKDPDCDWCFARLKMLVTTFLSDLKLTVDLLSRCVLWHFASTVSCAQH